MPDSTISGAALGPEAAAYIDRACDLFEAAWQAGQRPSIETFLQQAPPALQQELLRKLLDLDVVHRQRRGEQPTPGEYRQRFPALPDATLSGASRTGSPLDFPLRGYFAERYEILDEVGRGGMGVVYRGRHKILDRPVAIKITLPNAAQERFLREAKILARIKSPFVVMIHDFDVLPGGAPILVMEWIEGCSLRQVLAQQSEPLEEERVIRWMQHACEGMLAAAQHGIVHRDLKPSNLLIDRQDCARVADFGLARAPTAVGDALSQPGQMMGTAYYMAPEQAEDPHNVDARADIYSFGATFYHALTGQPPFTGATEFAILYRHNTEPLASPLARRPDLSVHLSDLLERCLAKAPADRFASFAEILRHLRPAAGALSPWVISNDAELAGYLARYQQQRDSYLSEQARWNEELDVYTFPRGQVLRILRGDIVAQQVDAVVSSDACLLGMNSGVSRAIAEAAGPASVKPMQHLTPVRAGRALVTPGANLAARLIFHGVTAGYIDGHPVWPSRDLIAEIMASCFYHADSHEVRSIAFPLLGTGAQGFPRDVCLDTMFQFLARMFLRGLTSVRDARIVIYRDIP
jgi:serine/threonine protein kinase/O-acetyl-ADP-ribose deacetylase (regulator of RNase III)